MDTSVTVLIPHIPPRRAELQRAVQSVLSQTRQPDAVVIPIDNDHDGSALTRNRGLLAVGTRWTAFLDDDDQFLPQHLEVLLNAAEKTGADVVYPCGQVIGGSDPAARCGQPFDADILRDHSYIPVTSLVRTGLARACGGFSRPDGSDFDDWGFYLNLLDAGARFHHHHETTWIWHHWGYGVRGKMGNTSGLGSRW